MYTFRFLILNWVIHFKHLVLSPSMVPPNEAQSALIGRLAPFVVIGQLSLQTLDIHTHKKTTQHTRGK